MDFLYKTALDFIQLDPKEDIYRFIGRKLKEIVGDCIVLVNSYDKASDSIRVLKKQGDGSLFDDPLLPLEEGRRGTV